MTSAHILYIPTIFLLGFITGTLIRNSDSLHLHGDKDSEALQGLHVSGRTLFISFVIFLLTFIGTHFFEIPKSAKAVALALNGQEIFDKKPSYSSEEVYARILKFPKNGIEIYQEFTYTIDILFPLTLLAFIALLAQYVRERYAISPYLKLLLLVFPTIWFVSDMAENATVYRLLSDQPQRNIFLAGILGYITLLKFSLLLISILTPALTIIFATSIIRKQIPTSLTKNNPTN
jgi:hypothetical protein